MIELRRSARILTAVLLLVAVVSPARAQMPGSAGKALVDSELPDSTVVIRVVDGAMDRPMSGLTVELVAADGNNLSARTDQDGRAMFSGLTPDAAYVGRVVVEADGDGSTLETEPFRVPESGGLRFMLSPEELAAAAAAPRAAQGPMQMDPRRASGIPRPEPQDPPGRLTIRAVHGELHPTDSRAPVGAKIHLIGYAADGSISKVTKVMDDSERVSFDSLVTGGRVVYYAVALFERDGVTERLVSRPISLPPRVGVRLMLSGEKLGSGKPAVDDLPALEGLPAPAPGRVVVRVGGQVGGDSRVELVEVGNPEVVATSPLRSAAPGPGEVQGAAGPPSSIDNAPAPVVASVTRILGDRGQAMPGARASLYRAGESEPIDTGVTGADGTVPLGTGTDSGIERGDTKTEYVVAIDVHGVEFRSKPFTMPEAPAAGAGEKGPGMRVPFQVAWRSTGEQAVFDGVVADGDKVYVARVKAQGQVFRSTPFQLTPDAGAALTMVVYPGLVFSFHAGGEIDDENFWYQAQLTLYNPGKEPHMPEGGKVEIPLPEGAIAISVEDEMTTRVQAVDGAVLWRGPVPPGPVNFNVTFAVPVDDGRTRLSWPLPRGAFQSQLILRKNPGMELLDSEGNRPIERQLPSGERVQVLRDVPLREVADNEGRPLLVLPNLNIRGGESLVLEVRGLPQRPGWRPWVHLGVGLLVLGLIAWGVAGVWAGARARRDLAALELRRDRLVAELVSLEQDGQGGGSRAAELKSELVSVYRKLGITRE